MNDFESILARIRNEPPPHVRDAVRAVMGAACAVSAAKAKGCANRRGRNHE